MCTLPKSSETVSHLRVKLITNWFVYLTIRIMSFTLLIGFYFFRSVNAEEITGEFLSRSRKHIFLILKTEKFGFQQKISLKLWCYPLSQYSMYFAKSNVMQKLVWNKASQKRLDKTAFSKKNNILTFHLKLRTVKANTIIKQLFASQFWQNNGFTCF